MRLWFAVIAVGLVSIVSPQDPPQTPPTPPIFRAGVDVVQLDVSILDAARRPVHGLKKSDVRVLEDGRPQEVIELDEIRLNDVEPPPVWAPAVRRAAATNDLMDRRLIAVVMNDLSCCGFPGSPTTSDRWAIANEVAAAKRIVDSLGPRDLATIVLTHDLMPVQRFTDDRDALRAVIARFLPITEGGCVPPPPPPPLPNPIRDITELMGMAPQAEKAIIVFESQSGSSRGAPLCERRSYTVPDTGERVIPIHLVDPTKPADPRSLSPVPIYHVNVSGLGREDVVNYLPGRGPIGLIRNGDNPTGGRDYGAVTEVTSAVDDILEENDSYYLLGFRTSRPTADGKYRHLSIKVPGHNYLVRSREGYLRPKPAPASGSRAEMNLELARPMQYVSHILPNFDVGIHATVAAFAGADRAHDVLVMAVDLDHPVSVATANGVEELTLRTVAYADSHAKYDAQTTAKVAVPAGSTRTSASIHARLDVAPERYALWMTTHDSRTSLTGSVDYDIDVPDFSAHPVSLSGVVLGGEATSAVPVPAAFAGILPIVPTASRTFGTGQPMLAFFQVYQGGEAALAAATVTIRVLDGSGTTRSHQEITLAPDGFSPRRAADVRVPLPLGGLVHGTYLFTVEARAGDRISPKRDVPFSVR